MTEILPNDIEANIGNTPLLRIRGLKKGSARVYVKLEQFNPGGSIKDRVARTMIKEAEVGGRLEPGTSIVESSSGNTAIGLAMLGTMKGYPTYAICDRNVPAAKLSRIKSLGGNILYLPETPTGFDSVELRISLADQLSASVENCITLGQFSSSDNPKAHYETTGPEIWEQTDGIVDDVITAVGTCGTITGIGRFLKEHNRAIRIHGAEPVGSVIFGGERGNFLIQGGGLSFTPKILDQTVIDEHHKVSDKQAVEAIHRFAAENGIMVGGTSGWVLHVLYKLADQAENSDRVMVGVLPDGGDRYLDTLYDEPWLQQHGLPTLPLNCKSLSIDEEAVKFNCSIDEYEQTTEGGIIGLYQQLNLEVPQLLQA